jgi:hypothetical protein
MIKYKIGQIYLVENFAMKKNPETSLQIYMMIIHPKLIFKKLRIRILKIIKMMIINKIMMRM